VEGIRGVGGWEERYVRGRRKSSSEGGVARCVCV
jgi:hypothetical protein